MTDNFFGGKTIVQEEYKKPTTNPFMEFQKVIAGEYFEEEMLVPLMNWFSNNKYNISPMQDINRNFFWVSKPILCHSLFMRVNRSYKFIKYPKKEKEDDSLDFLKDYVKRYYCWSDREYNFYEKFIDLNDQELINTLDRYFAFDDKECRKLGIKRDKIKVKFEAVKKGFF